MSSFLAFIIASPFIFFVCWLMYEIIRDIRRNGL